MFDLMLNTTIHEHHSNTLVQPLKMDMDGMLRALSMLQHCSDYVKEIWLSSTAIKEYIAPKCTYKDENATGRTAIMGIKVATNNVLPKDWGILIHDSGKRIAINLVDGRCFEVPDVTRISNN